MIKLRSVLALVLLICGSARILSAEGYPVALYSTVKSTAVEILIDGVHSGSGNFVSADGLSFRSALDACQRNALSCHRFATWSS